MSIEGADGMQAVILAGGRGARLGAATDHCPKPLANIGGRPFLDYLIAGLVRHGFTDILLLAGYLAEQLKALEARLANMDIKLVATEAALKAVAQAGFDPVYGARPLKRAIQQQIENPLACACSRPRGAHSHRGMSRRAAFRPRLACAGSTDLAAPA